MRPLVALLCLALAACGQAEGDAAVGEAKAQVCVACHGVNGISPLEQYPNLAGQKAGYLLTQMRRFKSGERHEPAMKAMLGPLSDEDLQHLAAYYAGLDPCP